ncbi:unnamed protein product, partial [marine sediment metagenome]
MSSDKRVYKLNISGGTSGAGKGLSKLIEIDEKKFRFEAMKIGDTIKGGLIGFPNYEFEITGGSDASGFPMRKDVHGPVKKKILVSKRAIGYKPRRKGEKRRKTVRGNEITYDMTLINLKILKYGETELFREPNLGILYLAAILDQNNIPVEILDLEQYYGLESEDIDQIILEKIKYHDIIGITSLTNTFHLAIRFAKLAKNYSRKKIVVLGGPHVSFKYEEILNQEDSIDFICIKESENSFPKLISLITRIKDKNGLIHNYETELNKIKGLAYKNFKGEIKFTGSPNPVKIDILPLPARYLLSQENFYYKVASV